MYHELITLAEGVNLIGAEVLVALLLVSIIILLSALFFILMQRLVKPALTRLVKRTATNWDDICLERGVFYYGSWFLTGVVAHALTEALLPELPSLQQVLLLAAHLWILLSVAFLSHALLNAANDIYNSFSFAKQLPIRPFLQVIKLAIVLVVLIMALSALLNRSPGLLVSGLGAMTAVLMLIFKDPILGFAAGIQLSANKMLAVGDWLEMPKYNADGDVIDISLTTVKVRNWDQTITTIPTYALISDAFKNWRGMSDAGGRRIKRSIYIDMTSISFLDRAEIERLRGLRLLAKYISDKVEEIDSYNNKLGIEQANEINGRCLTNIGTFRAYLFEYLRNHANLRQDMIMIVRQLQPTAHGLPLEIYAFVSDIRWVQYEGIQADVFDHILAVVPQFGLRVFQAPSGGDLNQLSMTLSKSV